MGLFSQENTIKCGKCRTEFDLSKNKDGCPLCGFGRKVVEENPVKKEELVFEERSEGDFSFLNIPPSIKVKSGQVTVDDETKIWGSWLMFNDFFAVKFLARVLAWKIKNENTDYIILDSLITDSEKTITKYGLSSLKGFPNDVKNEASVGRLVNHFLATGTKMGLFEVRAKNKQSKNVWKEYWDNLEVTITKEGLEFARIENKIFDKGEKEQTLTGEEKNWLVIYLKQIDKKGYREYSVLKGVYDFLKKGNNGNSALWAWFENNEEFQDYIKQRSKRAKDDPRVFKKQLSNYARSFASAKISLLREMGVVRDKRNDYTIIGSI